VCHSKKFSGFPLDGITDMNEPGLQIEAHIITTVASTKKTRDASSEIILKTVIAVWTVPCNGSALPNDSRGRNKASN
jgi:hypothetical protein